MKQNVVTQFLGKTWKRIDENSPAILTGFAVVGVVLTAVQTYRAAPKCQEILAQKREEMKNVPVTNREKRREITLDTIKEIAPVMLPSVLIGGATIGCAIGSCYISAGRFAALSIAYNLAETTVKDLNSKMYQELGEKKAKEIQSKISQDKLAQNPLTDENKVIVTGGGKSLCYDTFSQDYFYGDVNQIARAINKISSRIRNEMYISYNEFRDELGLKSKPFGRDIGWNIDDAQHDGSLPITWGAVLDEYDRPCICIQYHIEPRRLKRSFGDRG